MKQAKVQGAISVSRDDPSTIHVRMSGYMTGDLVAQHRGEFLRILGEHPTPYWLFDLLDLSGFEPAAATRGAEWWRGFKEKHGAVVLFVTQYGAARMAASALGFSVGVRLVVCASMTEARAELARLRR